jgi:hypothetical protein
MLFQLGRHYKEYVDNVYILYIYNVVPIRALHSIYIIHIYCVKSIAYINKSILKKVSNFMCACIDMCSYVDIPLYHIVGST